VTHWNLTYEPPEHRPIDIPITHRILVDTPFACPRADTSITVDGALDDWPGLPFPCIEPAQVSPSALEWNGAGDCSFRFATAYDDENVYIAVETTDDRAFLDTHRRAGKQDGIELRFDARAAGIRNDERAQDEKRQARYQWIVIAPGEDGSPPTVLLPDSLAEGIRLAAVRTRQGHVCEVAIPVAYLEDLQEGQWTGFRLNATVIDYDSPRDVGTSLWWRPHWASTANWPASGTFLREE